MPSTRVFAKAEHEWLRIAAMVNPDWEALRALTQESPMYGMRPRFDWDYLVARGGDHQLMGVTVWRLLDERFADLLPNAGYRAGLEHWRDVNLEGNRLPFWHEVADFVRLCESGGIRYAVRSGPVQYAPFGMTVWPREWKDIEIEVDCSDADELDALVLAAKASVIKWWESWWQLHLPEGTRIDLGSRRPVAGGTHDSRTWGFWARPPVLVRAFDLDLYVLDPVLRVLDMAWCTWNSTLNQAGPWPLWAFARLKAAVESTSDFDWPALGALLRENVELTAGVPPEIANLWGSAALRDVGLAAWHVLWVLGMADRIYGLLPPGGASALVAPLAVVEPDLLPSAGRHFDERDGVYDCGVYRWKVRPSDEDLLFRYYIRGARERVNAGLWEEAPGFERRAMWVNGEGRRVNAPAPPPPAPVGAQPGPSPVVPDKRHG